ncbi:MAG: AAA family ATPase [Bacillota bacterium]|nr:AAA family ATPase [Bacillota bacterium]
MIILVGASASGKTEVAKYLLEAHGMKKAVTHTSRLPRQGEKDGVDYHFVSKEEFDRLYQDGKMVERVEYNDNYYGCSKAELSDDKCVILEPHGFHKFQSLNDPRLISFHLVADEKTRRKRMRERGDSEEAIESRLKLDREAFSSEEVGKPDFLIQTGNRPIEEIGEEIYRLYQEKLGE